MSLNGKHAIVTGGASGIAQACAELLAEAGAEVFIGDLNKEKGEAVAAAIRAKGQKATFQELDVTKDASIDAFAKAVLAKGPLDILVNGAGWSKSMPFLENDMAFWDKVIGLNFIGPMKMVRAVFGQMIERKQGKIVNISSDAGRVGSLGETVYSGAKGGLIAFTKSLAREGARHNVHVNCVCPGPTDTPLWAEVPDKLKEPFIKAIPMRRLAQPREVAQAVVYFASPQSDYVTGQILSVSGGLTMAG
ncbi:MAG: glucose 1-dehydrogenase [Rhodospirillales bacterium]|nr:glucose 1-dehydrogenase [Rhodospirillales bacterium]